MVKWKIISLLLQVYFNVWVLHHTVVLIKSVYIYQKPERYWQSGPWDCKDISLVVPSTIDLNQREECLCASLYPVRKIYKYFAVSEWYRAQKNTEILGTVLIQWHKGIRYEDEVKLRQDSLFNYWKVFSSSDVAAWKCLKSNYLKWHLIFIGVLLYFCVNVELFLSKSRAE